MTGKVSQEMKGGQDFLRKQKMAQLSRNGKIGKDISESQDGTIIQKLKDG
jgi:hypothetical protein